MRTVSKIGSLLAALVVACLGHVAHAQTAISALPSASTPLGGTSLVPVVQGSVTSKVTVFTFGLNAVDQTGGCLNTVGSTTIKPLLTLNDGQSPFAIGCATANGGTVPALSYDYNVDAIIFPTNQVARFLAGPANNASQAFQFCTGAPTFGSCTDALDIGSGSLGVVSFNRGVYLGGDGYMVAGGSPPSTTHLSATCTYSASSGGATAGKLTASSTGACSLTLELPYTDGGNLTQNGLVCTVTNLTTHTVQPMNATGVDSFNPYCTMTVTQTSGDILTYMIIGY